MRLKEDVVPEEENTKHELFHKSPFSVSVVWCGMVMVCLSEIFEGNPFIVFFAKIFS